MGSHLKKKVLTIPSPSLSYHFQPDFFQSTIEAELYGKTFAHRTPWGILSCDPHKDVVGGLILGDTGFDNWVKEAFLSVRDDEQEIPQIKKLKPKPFLETIVRAVCDEMKCSEEQILEKGRNENIGREIAIFLARDFSEISCKALSEP